MRHHWSVSEYVLPPGWNLERIRTESGDSGARLISVDDRLVVLDAPGESDYVELSAEVIIHFSGGLCLLREPDDPGWIMGQLGKDDSIICWGYYGEDLGAAIRAL